MGAAGRSGRAAERRRSARARGAQHVPGPRGAAPTRSTRGPRETARARACRAEPPSRPARGAVALAGTGQRAAGRLGLLFAGDAAVGRRRVPRRPRNHGARAGGGRGRRDPPRPPRHLGKRRRERRGAARTLRYSSFPILKILVPQSGQTPWIAGRPFFMVTCFGSLIST